MTNSKGLVQAWYKWQRIALPVANFRQGRFKALTYQIEHDLDHLASYVYTLGSKAISGEKIDYATLVKKELKDLDNISRKLKSCLITGQEKVPFAEFIDATHKVLEELSKLHLNNAT